MMNVEYARTGRGRVHRPPTVWTTVVATAFLLFGAFSADGAAVAQKTATADKTLVAWAALANLNQQGGSGADDPSGEQFDAIVFASGHAAVDGRQHFLPPDTGGPEGPRRRDRRARRAGPNRDR